VEDVVVAIMVVVSGMLSVQGTQSSISLQIDLEYSGEKRYALFIPRGACKFELLWRDALRPLRMTSVDKQCCIEIQSKLERLLGQADSRQDIEVGPAPPSSLRFGLNSSG
jgi:hypothetical protein